MDDYYGRQEVSNSDLSWLKNQLNPRDMPDPENAYRFGSLIDAMITENHRVNYFKKTLDDIRYSKDDFELAERMKRTFYGDNLCKDIASIATGQSVMTTRMPIMYSGIDFELNARCKWDFWCDRWGADLKSTTATTQEQFEAACRYFDYDRQRAWYMDISGSERDVLIGISKKNLKVFKVFIRRGDEFYNSGKAKYENLAFKWWTLYGNGRPSNEKDN